MSFDDQADKQNNSSQKSPIEKVTELVDNYEKEIKGYNETELEAEINRLVILISESAHNDIPNLEQEIIIDSYKRKLWIAESLLSRLNDNNI